MSRKGTWHKCWRLFKIHANILLYVNEGNRREEYLADIALKMEELCLYV